MQYSQEVMEYLKALRILNLREREMEGDRKKLLNIDASTCISNKKIIIQHYSIQKYLCQLDKQYTTINPEP